MPAKPQVRVAKLIGDVENLAQRLRVELGKAAKRTGMERRLRSTARDLRHRAAQAAEQVEKYAHLVRVGLEPPRPRPRARKAKGTA